VGLTTFSLKGGQGLNFALPVEYPTELTIGKNVRPDLDAADTSPFALTDGILIM